MASPVGEASKARRGAAARTAAPAAARAGLPHSSGAVAPANRCGCGGGCPACHATVTGARLSQPGDADEIGADRIAEQVLRPQVVQGPALPRQPMHDTTVRRSGHASDSSADKAQRRPLPAAPGAAMQYPAHVGAVLRHGARPLDAHSLAFFEPRFGLDLGRVRVHADTLAAKSSRALNARAYAIGSDIVFGSGEYRPDTQGGRRLLAHELAHVVQSGAPSAKRCDTIHRQSIGDSGDLAVIDYEIAQLQSIPVLGPEAGPVLMRLAQLQQQRNVLVGHGAAAPMAPVLVCTDKDRSFKISQQRNKCLNAYQRWAAYKAYVNEAASREDDRGRRLAPTADWGYYVNQDEFNRLDSGHVYQSLYDTYLRYYAGGGQYERQRQERQAEEDSRKPAPPKVDAADAQDDWSSGLRQIDLDRMQRDSPFGSGAAPPVSAAPTAAVQPGCHTDPNARRVDSGVCGPKRPDAAMQATLKAMAMPEPDLDTYYKAQRASLDRLNAAHLRWQASGKFPQEREFSPWEIEMDRITTVVQRWDLYNRPHPNNLERADFSERFFRTRQEYEAERQRRHALYLAAVADCGQSKPSHFECRSQVMAAYYPIRFGLYDAAALRSYNDIQIAMPVLREGGPVAGLVFHAAHEWAGWSTQRSADAANLAAGLTHLAAAKWQQVAANRQAGQSVAPPDEISPPPSHVAPAPGRGPQRPATTTTAGAADPWAGAVARPIDVTLRQAFASDPAPWTAPPRVVTPAVVDRPTGAPMRRPPGRGDRSTMSATQGTLTPGKRPNPQVERIRSSDAFSKDAAASVTPDTLAPNTRTARVAADPPRLVGRNATPSADTAGTGGIQEIRADLGTDGSLSVEINGQLKQPIPRAGAPNYNRTVPSGNQIGLTDYEAAHNWGPGFGDEARAGMMYAPRDVNQVFQNQGIESRLRELYRLADQQGATIHVSVKTTSHPLNTWRGHHMLKDASYRFEVSMPNGPRLTIGEVDIHVPPPTAQGTASGTATVSVTGGLSSTWSLK